MERPVPHGTEQKSSKRGSPKAVEGRCGAYLKGSDPPAYCLKWPLQGRTRCKLHGGKSKRGPDHPNWTHGQRSHLYRDLLDGALLKGYLAIQNDDDLIRTEEQIRLWTAREAQLVERLADSGESSASWRAARMAMGEVDGAQDPEELSAALSKLRVAVLQGAAREAAWDDLERCHEALRKLKELERKIRQSQHQMVSVDQFLHWAGLLTSHALRFITDDRARLAFAEGVNALARGEPIEMEPGMPPIEWKH